MSQLVQFIIPGTPGAPNKVIMSFDCSLHENHSRKSNPTRFPVENGQTVSDNLIVEPFDLELNGIITDTPIGGVQGLITEAATSVASRLVPPIGVVALAAGYAAYNAISGSSSPSKLAYQQFLQLQSNAQPFDVRTSLHYYKSMWISNISVPRSKDTGQAIEFTVQLVQLILVQPQSVNVQIFANPGLAANKGDLGQQGLGLPNGAQAGIQASANTFNGGVVK